MDNHYFPFTAIVGQELLKKALILNAINPSIGGVLIRGDKGTGKSTAVRSLRDVLPDRKMVEGCRFGCDPDGAEICMECRRKLEEQGSLPSRQVRMDGMLAHDHHGAKNIKDRVEHLLGFSATTGAVDNWVYDDVAETLILDDEMRRISENNPYAAVRMGEILLETAERGYWDAPDETLNRIREVLLGLEYELE
ncbi:cobaltochelatase subunit CobN [Methanothermobacter thermautotrophicus]|uniref:cobaltochelatase subunit CobN n=1 Tax=Methanothermobacter thermautotrophicus TaxID=145262 RepID=UPI003D7F4EE9